MAVTSSLQDVSSSWTMLTLKPSLTRFSFSSCKIEYRELGQELITRAMDRMKVLGTGRLCF